MLISNRQMKILEILSEEGQPIQIKQFAEKFELSVRTIQNDINRINYFLQMNQLPTLKRSPRGYVGIEDKNSKLISFLDSLCNIEAKNVVLTPEERIYVIYMLFLKGNGYIKIKMLSEFLGVSKGTIMNDLNQLREEIQALPFSIVSNSRNGIKLTGDECAIREFAINNYMEYADESCIYNVSDYYKASIWICQRFCETRSFEDTQCIYKQLREAENTIGRKFTARSFLFVISWIELAIERIRNDNIVSIERRKLEGLFKFVEFKAAYKLAWSLSKVFDIRFPIEEIGHIAIRFIGCNDASKNYSDNANNYAEFQIEICKLVQDIGSDLGIDFSDNLSLYNDLVYYIRPIIYRVINGIKIKNPLLNQIRSHFPVVFNAVKRNIEDVENLIGAILTEDELGYIAIHFASIIEKKRYNGKTRPNVLIVCDSGVGTCNLLMARIASMYEVNIIDKVTYYDLENALAKHKVDYILSTVDISHDTVHVIRVSPLINERDKILLDSYFQPRFTRMLDFERLMGILERNCIIRDKTQLIKELGEVYTLVVDGKNERGNDKMLKDVMDKEMIELNFFACDWEEAVREAGKLLIKGGCVEEKYVESMVNVVKTVGAYIVIGKGIALPHSRSTEGAKKIGISFLRLANPVCFGHPENDPVDLVFGLSSIDNKSHMHALRDLTKVLSDEGKVEKLRKVSTCDEVFLLLMNEEGIA